jgi:hypothetical protein
MVALGIGGGELISFLLKHHQNLVIDAVDIDITTVSIARDYFSLPTCEDYSCRLNVIIGDAWEYIRSAESTGRTFDFVTYDLYDAGVIAAASVDGSDSNIKSLRLEDNLQSLASVVDPASGIAILHIHLNSHFSTHYRVIKKHFRSVFLLTTGRSMIVVAGHYTFNSVTSAVASDGALGSSGPSGAAMDPCTDTARAAAAIVEHGKVSGYATPISFGSRYAPYCEDII